MASLSMIYGGEILPVGWVCCCSCLLIAELEKNCKISMGLAQTKLLAFLVETKERVSSMHGGSNMSQTKKKSWQRTVV
jgi:hypothetical protein